jgi:uncharacterized protein (DUF2141 family)
MYTALRSILSTATLLLAGLLNTSFNSPRGTVTIVITGLKSTRGEVLVSLYNQAAPFPDKADKAVGKSRVAIRDKTVRVTFENLPYGRYAAALVHDENSNLKMDFNFAGMPKEGFGFSNNATGTFGPPAFGKAAFVLDAAEKRTAIKVSYFL